MKRILLLSIAVNLAINLNAQPTGTLKDPRDGKTYKTVKIGKQVWMAENLAYKAYRGNYWAYDNNSSNVAKYGYLYDWQTARNVCPAGWSLPSDDDWNELIKLEGSKAGIRLKATRGWDSGGNGTNYYGFSALPGGGRGTSGGFDFVGLAGYWWSATEGSTYGAWDRGMYYDDSNVGRHDSNKELGFSVRCIKQQPFTDPRDGKTYKTVKIGNQVWMAENLAYKPRRGNYWAYYNDISNVAKYGYLYDWQTACNVCPAGWHLPSAAEWNQLTDFVGSNTEIKLLAKSSYGSDAYGFSAVLGGYRRYDGYFDHPEQFGYWWTSTEASADFALLRRISGWSGPDSNVRRLGYFKETGSSVRCLKD